MKKNVKEIIFDEKLVQKYKKENDKIKILCQKLDNDPKIQNEYKKFIKKQQAKDLKLIYNNISKATKSDNNKIKTETYEIPLKSKEIKFTMKNSDTKNQIIKNGYC